MKERPILFSAPMVRAILEGRKTVTRRVVKFPIKCLDTGCELAGCELKHELAIRPELCPYGQPGDRLWVREAFRAVGYGGYGQTTDAGYERFETIGVEFATGGDPVELHFLNGAPVEGTPESVDYAMAVRLSDSGPEGNRPSIHMPRWASRITLEVAGVRVERLQMISDAGAIAEGIQRGRDGMYNGSTHPIKGTPKAFFTPTSAFDDLWGSINGAGSWPSNPWVWVIEFKRVDHLAKAA